MVGRGTQDEHGEVGSLVVVVAAHGSRAEAANIAHRDAVAALAATGGPPVTAAFLELAEPSIPDAIDAAVAGGAAVVAVLPYFLYPGRHLTVDLPSIVEAAATRHPGRHVRLLSLFGADPGLTAVLADQVRRAQA